MLGFREIFVYIYIYEHCLLRIWSIFSAGRYKLNDAVRIHYTCICDIHTRVSVSHMFICMLRSHLCFFSRLEWARGVADGGRCGSLGCVAVGFDLSWEGFGGLGDKRGRRTTTEQKRPISQPGFSSLSPDNT